MENLKSIISSNILALRKKNGLTQIDLAKQINYSDKAISRWENGDVVPDVETLNSLAKIFNVPLTYLFEQHRSVDIKLDKPSKNESLYHFMTVAIIWTCLAIVFSYFYTFLNKVYWKIFIWGIPLTCMTLLFFYRKWNFRKTKFILKSITCWAILTCICIQFINENLWLIFIAGIPIQITIIMSFFRIK